MTATIKNIKTKFKELVGEDIVVIVEAGRRKTKTHEGRLTETYPSVFVVELTNDDAEESYERVSFNYTDVLTNTIEVQFPDYTMEVEELKETEEV